MAILLGAHPAHSKERPQAPSLDHPFVSDGATLEVGPHEQIRLYGIDAPELRQVCDDGKWPAGRIAREALERMIGGREVTCEQVDWDSRYGRPVSRCRVGDTDLSEAMVREGMAWAFVRDSTVFGEQEREAVAHKLGVHGHSCVLPSEWRASLRRTIAR